MPEVGVVQKPGLFEDLLRRLGVNRPMRPFTLDGNILPVVIVESGVSFIAAPTPAYRATEIFSAGVLTNPAASTIMADTGPLPPGSYTVLVTIWGQLTNNYFFQWRDAANAVNLSSIQLGFPADEMVDLAFRLLVENNGERFRVGNIIAGGAGNSFQATILAKI